MKRRTISGFTFLSFFVLSFFVYGYGAGGRDGGDSLIVADFSGMPGDTVVDSVTAVNTVPLEGFTFRVVYDTSLLIPLVVSPAARTDYFLTWDATIGADGWLYLIALTDDLFGGTRPPLPAGRGLVAYIVFLVSSDADSGQFCDVKFENSPPQVNSFVDTLTIEFSPSLKNGRFTVDPSGVDNFSECLKPSYLFLAQNYPNPFNSTTAISYQVSAISNQFLANGRHRTAVTLRVYNIAGQLVKVLVDGRQNPGVYSVVWDGRNAQGQDVGSGIYLYMLRVGDRVFSRKMVLLR
jgi:hypothetical protein